MGLFDSLKGKKPEEEGKTEEKAEKDSVEAPAGKYSQACALCGAVGTEKKWMGQYWHKRCCRAARKGARKMV